MDALALGALVASSLILAGVAVHAHWRLASVVKDAALTAKGAHELARAVLASNRFLPAGGERPLEPAIQRPPEPTLVDLWKQQDETAVY